MTTSPPSGPHEMLLESSPLPTWIIDRETGRFLFVNPSAVLEYGYSRDEFLALSIEAIRLPEETGQLAQYVQAQVSGPFVVSGSWYHRRKDGSVFPVQLRAEKITFAGRPALLTYVLDPEREGALAALKIRERQLAESQALAHLGSWEWDIPVNHSTWSTELYRIYGLPPGTPAGYTEFMDRVHPEDRERIGRIIAVGLEQRRPSFEYECRIVRPDGDVRHILNRHVVTLDSSLQPVRMAGTVLDITDRRRAELALAASERYHRELVENSSDLVTIVSATGVIEYMSPSVQRVLGYAQGELVGRSVFGCIHSDDAPSVLAALRRDLAEPGVPNTVELRFRHRDGSWRILESIGQAREQQPGVYAIIVNSRDISDRKTAEARQRAMLQELREARQAAEAATRALREATSRRAVPDPEGGVG